MERLGWLVSASGVIFCRPDRIVFVASVMTDTILSLEGNDVGILSKIASALEEIQGKVRNQISAMDAKSVLVEKLQENVDDFKVFMRNFAVTF